MALDVLVSIVAPPSVPIDSGQGKDWAAVEKTLGTALPTDYKKFINLFGTGMLADQIWIYNPFSPAKSPLDLITQSAVVLGIQRYLRADFDPSEVNYALFPEPTGLLPWGRVDQGSQLFWQTIGTPDEWRVVVNEGRGPEFQEFDMSMTGFLVSLFTGRIKTDILPRSLQQPRKRAAFVPVRT